jgi:hypothetical protein
MRLVLTSVQGVSDFKRVRSGDDRFAFLYLGRSCVVHEPFGDNSRYWIGPVEKDPPIDMTAIAESFSRFRLPFTIDQIWRPRLLGAVVTVAGSVLFALGVRGVLDAPALALSHLTAELSRGSSLNVCAWRTRWIWWSSIVAGVGGAIGISGIAVAFRRRWGFLILAIAAALGALGPWILKVFDLAKYPYERANILETVILIAFSLLALRGFLGGSGRTGA